MMSKLLVKKILESALSHQWFLQGLGMLRLYLSDSVRLHVWSPRHAVDNVSIMHDHPWSFESQVIAGHLYQERFVPCLPPEGAEYHVARIKCGPGGAPGGGLEPHAVPAPTVRLKGQGREFIEAFRTYTQLASEIHETYPAAGSVTIVERKFGPTPDHANVFWPVGYEWVSAEPRVALNIEVHEITKFALERWFQ